MITFFYIALGAMVAIPPIVLTYGAITVWRRDRRKES